MMSSAEKYYQSLALYYKNLAAIKRCRATVHVEGKTDLPFWGSLFKRYFPKDRFYFISYSKSFRGRATSGCTQCLKYRAFLDKRFFICIDSDYRRLVQEPNIDIQHYIFQTYTYSFENHLCFADGLDAVCEEVCHLKNTVFDFRKFLRDYSSVIYELFIWQIALQNYEIEGFSKSDFINTIDSRNIPFDIEHQAQSMLDTLKEIVDERIRRLKAEFPGIHIDKEKAYFVTLGVREDNTYLYTRGHNLYHMVSALCNQVCNRLLELKKRKYKGDVPRIVELYDNKDDIHRTLKRSIPPAIYPEMKMIEQDMETFARL